MQTIDEEREHCRFVGKGIEKMVADGEDLNAKFEGASWAANNVCRWTNEFLKGIATMKKTVMMVATCLMAAITFAEGYDSYEIPTNITSQISVDEFTALQLLIHVNWIASRISMEGTVLEDEYKLINHEGLDLSFLKDEEARECLKNLSDAITNARKKSGDMKMAERV